MSEKRAAQRSYAEWDNLVDEWVASGKQQSEFALEQGIKPSTFQSRVHQSRKRRGLGKFERSGPYQVLEVSSCNESGVETQRDICITLSTTRIEFSSSSDTSCVSAILSQLGCER